MNGNRSLFLPDASCDFDTVLCFVVSTLAQKGSCSEAYWSTGWFEALDQLAFIL